MTGVVALGVCAVLYALTASRLDRLSIGAPLVFLLAGAVLGPGWLDVLAVPVNSEPFKLITELTLALLLFTDASTVRLARLKEDAGFPARLLMIGLPLTLVLGTLLARLLAPSLAWPMAALIATILAPTDAALSLPVVSNAMVPVRIRRALNVESGLNDGIATPIVAVLLAIVAAEAVHGPGWVAAASRSIGGALLVAAIVGAGGGRLVAWARARGWTTSTSEQLLVLVAALLAYLAAVGVEGNGFVAAFTAGLFFGSASGHVLHEATEHTETSGMFLSFAVWALFGAALVGPVLAQQWRAAPIAYAILSLTVVRMLCVAVALYGSRLHPLTILFVGWFGPRGLASVVFLVIAVDDLGITQLSDPLVQTVVWTIALSVVLHGLTSAPLARAYGVRIGALRPPPSDLATGREPHLRRRTLTATTAAADSTRLTP